MGGKNGAEKVGMLSGGLIASGSIAVLWPIVLIFADPWLFAKIWLSFYGIYRLMLIAKPKKVRKNAGIALPARSHRRA